jgi:hypothetical protein
MGTSPLSEAQSGSTTIYIPARYPNGLSGGIPSLHFDDRDEVDNAIEGSEKSSGWPEKSWDIH